MANFVLIGMSGSGKSTIGRMAAELTGLEFLDMDNIIESKHGLISNIFNEYGEETFRNMETDALKECLVKNNSIIAT